MDVVPKVVVEALVETDKVEVVTYALNTANRAPA